MRLYKSAVYFLQIFLLGYVIMNSSKDTYIFLVLISLLFKLSQPSLNPIQ